MNKLTKLTTRLSLSVGIVILILLPLFIKNPYTLYILIWVGISIALASSLRVINLSGLLSLGHGGIMLIGAYISTLLVMRLGISSWISLVLAGFASGGFACLIGFPFVRLKGIYFSMVTLFMTEMIILISEQWKSLTGGSAGIINIPHPDPIIIPRLININFTSKVDLYYLMLVLTLATLLIIYLIEHSRIGLTWRTIRQDDSLAESIGINTTAFKVLGFSLGCFLAGIFGAFYSQFFNVIHPQDFGFFFSIYILVYMIVGGRRHFVGPVLGVLILVLIPELIGGLGGYRPFIFVAILMIVLYTLPDGLVSLPSRIMPKGFRNWCSKRFNRA